MVILVPAYEPGRSLVDLVDALSPGSRVVVVDDGSGPAYAPAFAQVAARGAEVLSHPVNRGKGAALRTGFAHIARRHPGEPVVCADSDGQHRPDDIAAVAAAVGAGGGAIVLGARDFAGPVPLRSRVGNDVTRVLFGALTGRRIDDTQTGLRGYPPDLLPWLLAVPGDRFGYEQQLLLTAVAERRPIIEVPIETVYLAGNASSHFRPVRDSWAVYRPLLRHAWQRVGAFGLSSLTSWAVDVALFALLTLVGLVPALALVAARLVSAALNFTVNRHWVFGRTAPGGRLPALLPALARYAALSVAYLAVHLLLLTALLDAGAWPLPAKIAGDLLLFGVSFTVQRHWWSADRGVTRLVEHVDRRAAGVGVDRQ